MQYYRYLREVVQALESDPEFRERLEKADEEDVRVSVKNSYLDILYVVCKLKNYTTNNNLKKKQIL